MRLRLPPPPPPPLPPPPPPPPLPPPPGGRVSGSEAKLGGDGGQCRPPEASAGAGRVRAGGEGREPALSGSRNPRRAQLGPTPRPRPRPLRAAAAPALTPGRAGSGGAQRRGWRLSPKQGRTGWTRTQGLPLPQLPGAAGPGGPDRGCVSEPQTCVGSTRPAFLVSAALEPKPVSPRGTLAAPTPTNRAALALEGPGAGVPSGGQRGPRATQRRRRQRPTQPRAFLFPTQSRGAG